MLKNSKIKNFVNIPLLAWMLTSCDNTNLNQLILSPLEKQGIESLLEEARFEYDKGNFDRALNLAEEAKAINNWSEESLLLQANIYLSMAGFDPFAIAGNLIDQSDNKTTTEGKGDSSSTSKALSSLADLIGISNDDIEQLSLGKEPGLSVTVYLPKSRSEARAGNHRIISKLSAAIQALCPIINNTSAKDPERDPAHTCEASPFPTEKPGAAKFSWALANLAEAVTFYSVVMYGEGGVPNIQKVTSTLDTKNPTLFLAQMSSIVNVIDKIFPTDPNDPSTAEDSMLNAIFNDLKFTSYAFSSIGGIPTEVTSQINTAITDLENKVKTISGAKDSASASISDTNQALKDALTTGISQDIASKISTLQTAEQKQQACELYKRLDPLTTPTGC